MTMTSKKFDVNDIIKRTNKVAENKAKMEALLKDMNPDSREAAKNYISKKEIPQLFESITAGMLHHRPENPVQFLQDCLDNMGKNKTSPKWDTFINFTPSDKSMRAPTRSTSSKSNNTAAQPQSTTPSESTGNTSNNAASYTPAPISAHPSNRSRASPTDIQTFP